MNSSHSAGKGGSPVKSSVTRRNRVARSAGGAGWRPSFSSRANINASTSVWTHEASRTAGRGGQVGLWKAQWARSFSVRTGSSGGLGADCSAKAKLRKVPIVSNAKIKLVGTRQERIEGLTCSEKFT